MSVSVRIPAIIRSYTGGSAEVAAAPGTLREVIAGLDATHPVPGQPCLIPGPPPLSPRVNGGVPVLLAGKPAPAAAIAG
jgi:hypothetical protein